MEIPFQLAIILMIGIEMQHRNPAIMEERPSAKWPRDICHVPCAILGIPNRIVTISRKSRNWDIPGTVAVEAASMGLIMCCRDMGS